MRNQFTYVQNKEPRMYILPSLEVLREFFCAGQYFQFFGKFAALVFIGRECG